MKFKKLFFVISLVLTLTSVFSIVSCALTTAVVKGSDGSMNMRSGPGTTHSLVVTVPNNTVVTVNGKKFCDDGSTNAYWYNVSCTVNGKQYSGYISSAGISSVKTDGAADGTYLEGTSKYIPDIYLDAVNKLKQAHPNWSFQFLYTGLDWYDVIKNETKLGVNSIDGSAYPISYRSTTVNYTPGSTSGATTGVVNDKFPTLTVRSGPGTTYEKLGEIKQGTQVTILDTVSCSDGSTSALWYKVTGVTTDGKTVTGYVSSSCVNVTSGASDSYKPVEGSNWYQAHGQVVSYHIDPRNFLTESGIFQFEELTYNSNVHTLKGIQSILKGSFMDGAKITTTDGRSITYAEAFMEAGKKHNVSPYHLASKVLQEVGRSGSKSTSGDNSTYPGIYNFYNIGANTGYLDGLRWASDGKDGTYGRPWNTQYKSIIGGAEFIASGYISKGQNTIYFEKFDFIAEGGVYSHQYAADVTYSKVQAKKIYESVYSEILNTDFCFIIPVFMNMPKNVCALPESSTKPNLTPDCPALTNTVDPKPTSYTGEPNSGGQTEPDPTPTPEPTPSPGPNPNLPVIEVTHPDCGDVNLDGKISVVDAKQILKYIAGTKQFTDEEKIRADITCDGKINIVDAKKILQIVAGLLDVKVSNNTTQTTQISTSDYVFTMPSGWDYSEQELVFFKDGTETDCYVKIESYGYNDEKNNYTLDNWYNQILGTMSELVEEEKNNKHAATVSQGSFEIANADVPVKYCSYICVDENNNVIDSQYTAFVLIKNQIFCIQYNCNGGIGYDESFDFTEHLKQNFVIK